jgi:hypothetical protein
METLDHDPLALNHSVDRSAKRGAFWQWVQSQHLLQLSAVLAALSFPIRPLANIRHAVLFDLLRLKVKVIGQQAITRRRADVVSIRSENPRGIPQASSEEAGDEGRRQEN